MTDLTILFCSVDDFWKQFRSDWEQHLMGLGKARRGPEPELSVSEMMTIVILFHQSNYRTFKHFYGHVCTHFRPYFPKLISYDRFVHTMKTLFIPLFAYLLRHTGAVTGIAFIRLLSKLKIRVYSPENSGGEMKFETVKELDDEKFRRLAGIKRTTFNKMVLILEQSSKEKKINGGRKNKLSIENMLLMTLEYIREYRTYFHISQSYDVSESTAYKTVRWIEDTLIKHPDFALPGRKALLKSDVEYEVVLVDATETPIERPKKNKSTFTRERRKSTL